MINTSILRRSWEFVLLDLWHCRLGKTSWAAEVNKITNADSGCTHLFQFPRSHSTLIQYYTHESKNQHGNPGHESPEQAETVLSLHGIE